MIYVDTDNALGSPRGDVDDGFALAALLKSRIGVTAVASVFGNTSEAAADANNRVLGQLCGFTGTYLRGAPARGRDSAAARYLVAESQHLRIAALGPLTNIAAAIEHGAMLREVVLVGGNLSSRGRWPPFHPFEFNLVKDRRAARIVLESAARVTPVTIVPLDVARRMSITRADLDAVTGEVGRHLSAGSARWFRRARLIRWSRTIPLWDLAAAACFLAPDFLAIEATTARVHANGWLELGADAGQPVRVVRALDRDAIWRRAVELMNGAGSDHDAKLESDQSRSRSLSGGPADGLLGARAAAGERCCQR